MWSFIDFDICLSVVIFGWKFYCIITLKENVKYYFNLIVDILCTFRASIQYYKLFKTYFKLEHLLTKAFIYSRQRYGPDTVWGKSWLRSVLVMLRFVTVHSWSSPGGSSVCLGKPRFHPGHRRQSPAVSRCLYGQSRT